MRIQGVAGGVPVAPVVVGVQAVGIAPPVGHKGFTVPPHTTVLFLSITQGAFTPVGVGLPTEETQGVAVGAVGAVFPLSIDCLVAKSCDWNEVLAAVQGV